MSTKDGLQITRLHTMPKDKQICSKELGVHSQSAFERSDSVGAVRQAIERVMGSRNGTLLTNKTTSRVKLRVATTLSAAVIIERVDKRKTFPKHVMYEQQM
jgi:hypothetical protein